MVFVETKDFTADLVAHTLHHLLLLITARHLSTNRLSVGNMRMNLYVFAYIFAKCTFKVHEESRSASFIHTEKCYYFNQCNRLHIF